MTDPDLAIRLEAFRFLEEQTAIHGEVIPWAPLTTGFLYQDRRVPLLGQPGIFKPAVLNEIPISIRTAPPRGDRERPYEDEFTAEGLLHYRYKGTDPQSWDNVGLRKAMEAQAPLIYFHGVVTGQYLPFWPVFIVGDDPSQLTFTVAIDERHMVVATDQDELSTNYRRAYATRLARQRLHQAGFRVRVIAAYREMCAVCRLRHKELLDAAHILPESHPQGDPIVSNGLSLCKLHHAAFDQNIIGITPGLVIEVNGRILEEIDGPMLVHGLQGFHGAPLTVPARKQLKPNPDFLAERYDLFESSA